jgi:type VI secretion system protein ImpF
MDNLKERLQPSLLDRLTDHEPDKRVESRDKRVLSPTRLRESVRRDLAWLLNTTNLASVEELGPYPEVARSVVNYGIPELAGKTKVNLPVEEVERMIREAIWQYEPRLNKKTLQVRLMGDRQRIRYNNMYFSIEAELWAHPLPMRLFLRTELDLESGTAKVSEVSTTGPG